MGSSRTTRLCFISSWTVCEPHCLPPPTPVLEILDAFAKLCTIVVGVLLTCLALMTRASLVRRNITGDAIVGAFGLTGVAAGASAAPLMPRFKPICQLRRSDIVMDRKGLNGKNLLDTDRALIGTYIKMTPA